MVSLKFLDLCSYPLKVILTYVLSGSDHIVRINGIESRSNSLIEISDFAIRLEIPYKQSSSIIRS